ncbi:MAG TPA: hypothetical protein VGC89_08040 [Pyrinomonadaceae bacterium]|jgi:hypothetical protein
MAKKTDKDYRDGPAKDQAQAQETRTDNGSKHDTDCGGLMDAKGDSKPFKGAASGSSIADKKMMRAWDTINENRHHGAKSKH